MLNRILYICLILVIITTKVSGQDVGLSLANEYFQEGEYEKARVEYEKLSRKDGYVAIIYSNYVKTLLELNKPEEAQKFIKRAIKLEDDHTLYEIDHLLISVKINGEDKSEKEFLSFVNEIKGNPVLVEKAAAYFLKNSRPAYAGRLYEAARRESGTKWAYAQGLANVYGQTGEKEKMIDELLNWLDNDPTVESQVKNTLQNNLRTEDDYDLLEARLYEKIEKNPNQISYNQLLLWLHIQRKNFSKAFIQAKAIDKRTKAQGEVLIEIGQIALENGDYTNAARYFETVCTEYKNSPFYVTARRLYINTREEEVKHTYPVNVEHVKALVTQYRLYIKEIGASSPSAAEAGRNMALLYAFYLNNIDSAEVILNQIINQPGADYRLMNKAKIDLGDILVLKGEPWESTLLYSQVEKAMKEDPLGHQAKFSNAKLAYYRGDFDLAKQHLDILKLATTREISNDAIDLSLFIQVNVDYDSNYAPLKKFADAELLLFRHQYQEALSELNEILDSFPGHPLTDDVWFRQAQIYRQIGKTDESIVCLEKILRGYAQDILGDDAMFMLASIWDQDRHDPAKAMEYYQQCMLTYPSSIFTTEARRRYRTLRGDKI